MMQIGSPASTGAAMALDQPVGRTCRVSNLAASTSKPAWVGAAMGEAGDNIVISRWTQLGAYNICNYRRRMAKKWSFQPAERTIHTVFRAREKKLNKIFLLSVPRPVSDVIGFGGAGVGVRGIAP